MLMEDDEEIDNLRNRIAEKTGCQNVAVSEAERYDTFSLLKIKDLKWFKQRDENDMKTRYPPKVRMMRVRDGYLILFKDNAEELKELSADEKKYLKDKETTLKNSRNSLRYSFREKSLLIKEQDIEIEFDIPDIPVDDIVSNVPEDD